MSHRHPQLKQEYSKLILIDLVERNLIDINILHDLVVGVDYQFN